MHSERQNWWTVKAKLIERYGTLSAAAADLKCHPNSLRSAARGRCPDVLIKINQKIQKPEPATK
jgi:hypothetical protein